MRKIDQRIILVVRKTRLDELTAKFNTKAQAKFYVSRSRVNQAMARAGGQLENVEQVASAAAAEVAQIEQEGNEYQGVVTELRRQLDFDIPVQAVDRSLVPNMVFGPQDVVVAVGQDGLVANVAKYAVGLPIIGVNPNPAKYDGVLLPFEWKQARAAVQRTLEGRSKVRKVTLAQAQLNNGQRLLAFNDFFIGAKTHVSARYRVEVGHTAEEQSSSGMLVSTGAGSTGWLSSVLNMATGIMTMNQPTVKRPDFHLRWEDQKLVYVVREPFVSKTSSARIIAGTLGPGEPLIAESFMGSEGTIFSDGVESDSLAFSEGAIVTISIAPEQAQLVVP